MRMSVVYMDLSMRAGSLDACENIGRFQKEASRAAGFVAVTTSFYVVLVAGGGTHYMVSIPSLRLYLIAPSKHI